jgi:hypothetical protein
VTPPLPADEARVLLDDFLLLLPKLFDLFDRSSEVDDAVHVELARHFETTTTTTTEEENELINEVLKYEKQDWRRIRGTVLEPVEYFQVLAKGKSMLSSIGRFKTKAKSPVGVAPDSPLGKIVRTSTSNASNSPLGKVARTISSTKSPVGANTDDFVEGAWGKATTNIDVSANRCLAFFWHSMSYEGNSWFEKNHGRLLKMQVDVPDSHSMFTVNSIKIPFPGVNNRILAAKWAWRREENGVFVAGFASKGTPLPPSFLPPLLPPLTPPPPLFVSKAPTPTSSSSGPSRKMSGQRDARRAPRRASGGSHPSPPPCAARPSSSK